MVLSGTSPISMENTGSVTMSDNMYRVTRIKKNGSICIHKGDSDMFHSLCRAVEYCERDDVKVTVELIKEKE